MIFDNNNNNSMGVEVARAGSCRGWSGPAARAWGGGLRWGPNNGLQRAHFFFFY